MDAYIWWTTTTATAQMEKVMTIIQKAAYPTIGIAAFVIFVEYFIGCLQLLGISSWDYVSYTSNFSTVMIG